MGHAGEDILRMYYSEADPMQADPTLLRTTHSDGRVFIYGAKDLPRGEMEKWRNGDLSI
jgi:hypothetical protein